LITNLQRLVRQPSISSEGVGMLECAKLVVDLMTKAGIESHLLFLNNNIPPAVFGEVKSKRNSKAKTILFYNHYDTQPIKPIKSWKYHPLSASISDGMIIGRGSSDDKGELIARIAAIQHLLTTKGDVPCNIKFLVEGEEEIGSLHLYDYLVKYGNNLQCNAVIWESGYVNQDGRPVISLGMKGLMTVEMIAKGAAKDIHSSLAVLIHNPIWRIVNTLKTIWNDEIGEVLIKDWYREATEFSADDLDII